MKLDSALQESLDEVRRQADELRASRARIVEAGDAQRRRIERDLHDGAQQHLVALAVSVRLVRQIADSDPDSAKAMLDQIGERPAGGGAGAAQPRARHLPAAAHGPRAGARRSRRPPAAPRSRPASRPRASAATRSRSRRRCTSAASRRCRTRRKHAGEGAEAMVTVREDEGALLFEVRDDGAGFDLATGAHAGHGFVNMGDRVGAIGGTLPVESAPGQGTAASRGRIPLAPARATRERSVPVGRRRRRPDVADDVGAELLLVHVRGGAAVAGVGGEVVGLVGGERASRRRRGGRR